MTAHPSDLSALVGSRICHDLISPLGAIGNGLELLTLTGTFQPDGAEMELISQSVENANARIRFFRVAFGAATPGQKIPVRELHQVLSDSFRGGRIALSASLPQDIERCDAKLALLLVLCLETALPRGGEISVQGGPTHWQLRAKGPRVSTDPQQWQGLTGPVHTPASLSAAEVQFALVPEAAEQAGRAVIVDLAPDHVAVRF